MKIYPTIIISLAAIFTGCSIVDNWQQGDVEAQRFPINSNVNQISIKNTFEITLIQDDNLYIDVICSENMHSKIQITLDDNTLILDNSISNRWLYGYDKVQLEIHLPSIPTINVYKPASIKTSGCFTSPQFYLIDWGNFTECDVDVQVDFLRVDSSGDSFGSYTIKGSAQKSVFYSRGSAKFNCDDFQTDTCQIYQASIMDFSINANSQLDVIIESSGDVYYTGNPLTSLIRNGSGKLIKR